MRLTDTGAWNWSAAGDAGSWVLELLELRAGARALAGRVLELVELGRGCLGEKAEKRDDSFLM